MKHLSKGLSLFVAGGITYGLMELVWQGHTHWTMVVLGGAMFLIVGGINEYLSWDMPLALQGIIGSVIITVAELLSGSVLNIWLGLDIWDYSHLPLNFHGQICLSYSLLWVALSIFAVVLDDWLRYRWFGEERPHYVLF